MKRELFYPAPEGLPVPVRPREGDAGIRRQMEETDWRRVCGLADDALVRAGAFWLYGFLDVAHRIAQEQRSKEGSYWHALVHRSEGDYDNSLYWFGRVGNHPIFPRLRGKVEAILRQTGEVAPVGVLSSLVEERLWNPRRFVELCRLGREGELEQLALLQRMAAAEYNLLMAHILGVTNDE